MNENERVALRELRFGFNWVPNREDVWRPLHFHVNGLHNSAASTILNSIAEARAGSGSNPPGVVIIGPNGAGKTHLLRRARSEVQAGGGYFFLMSLLSRSDFWENVVEALVTGLLRADDAETSQLDRAVRQLAVHLDIPDVLIEQIVNVSTPSVDAIDEFVTTLRRRDRILGRECHNTVRAVLLLATDNLTAQDVGESFLMSRSEINRGERRKWGIQREIRPPKQIVYEISRVLALTGPSLFAVDQIDTLIAQSTTPGDTAGAGRSIDIVSDELAEQLGNGLMELHEVVSRTVSVVSCLPTSWELIRDRAVVTAKDRFRQILELGEIPTPRVGEELVAKHFAPRFARIHDVFAPPYPTWPVLPIAFVDSPKFTPRALLRVIDLHLGACLDTDKLIQLATFGDSADTPDVDQLPTTAAPDERLVDLDKRFTDLLLCVDYKDAVDPRAEDNAMPALLDAALQSWIDEQGDDRQQYSLDGPVGARPAVYARLRRILDEATADQIHWTFRSTATRSPNAVIHRIERLRVVSGLDPDVRKRKVFMLRTAKWKIGPVTRAKIDEFEQAGGVVLELTPDDLRKFAALKVMREDNEPALQEWLRQRRPVSNTALFVAIFGEPGPLARKPDEPGPTPVDRSATARATSEAPPTSGTIPLGTEFGSDATVSVPLESLRKHIAIFAGSGSGKTVLLRRIVEECALQGVSAIVLDPNNDLSRLGDAWPSAPSTWNSEDEAKAAAYIAGTDVVIWTPRRETGRPLSLQPLPDFGAVLDDPDEFSMALDTAVAALAPRAKMDGTTAKAERGRAVLREALAYFSRRGESGLNAFLDMLADLPGDVTTLAKASVLAEEMSQTLMAAVINDPLFGGSGVPLDPGTLLTPPPGKRARVSVISMIGLPTNPQRQSFVNQLEMALFAWIKGHPAGDRPLGGLFVMDEAQTLAPSGAMTACTESTLALASQARKYGLGLVFATQAPRGIHNRIVGNAATQFYGFLNSPAQIAAAREMAQAKASTVIEISHLTAGQFYMVSEGMPFRKVMMPMSLSHHPSSALTAEEVIARARRST